MRKFLAHAWVRGWRCPPALPAVLALLVVPSTARSAPARSTSLEEQQTRTVGVETETKVSVKNARGKTIIVGRRDATGVTIRVVKHVRAGDARTAAKWMSELGFEVDTDGEQVSVVSHYPEKTEEGGNFWAILRQIKDKAYIEFTIEVPSRFGAKVSSASGDVQVTSIEGDLRLSSSSGDVFLKGIGGSAIAELSSGNVEVDGVGKDVRVRMSSGDVIVRNVGGSVSIGGTSGDVEVYDVEGGAGVELESGHLVLDGCRGDVMVKTNSGDAEVREVGGAVEAATGSGDLQVMLDAVGTKEHAIKTSSGDVEVSYRTPEGYGFLLEVNTSSGSIEGDLDIKLEEISRKTRKGVVGTGEGSVYNETASGDIRINQVGN